MKSFWILRDTVKEIKVQTKDWEILFAKHASEKDFYLEYRRNSYNSNIRSQISQFKKRYF